MPLVKTKTPPGQRNLWRTPHDEYTRLDAQYGPFTLDAAADASNHKTPLWLGPGSGRAEDALSVDWCNYDGTPARVFCNPPYSRPADDDEIARARKRRNTDDPYYVPILHQFVAKAHHEVMAGHARSATLLVPATTDVRWFHEYVWNAAVGQPRPFVALNFSVGRLQFVRPDGALSGPPTFGSMVVHFAR